MAPLLNNTLFGTPPKLQSQTVTPVQKRPVVADQSTFRKETEKVYQGRRSAPAVQIRLSSEALAILNDEGASANAAKVQKQANSAAFQLPDDDEVEAASPVLGEATTSYGAQSSEPARILPPGSHLDITL